MTAFEGPRLTPAIVELAECLDCPFALVGGCAMRVYGSLRVTYDVDVVSKAVLPGSGWRSKGPLSFGGRRYTIAGIEVDVIVRSDEYGPLYRAALREAKTHFVFEGRKVRVVSPEFLVLMKLDSGRGKDDDDVDFLLGKGRTDRVKLRKMAERYLGLHARKVVEARIEERDLLGGRDRTRIRRRRRRT